MVFDSRVVPVFMLQWLAFPAEYSMSIIQSSAVWVLVHFCPPPPPPYKFLFPYPSTTN